MVLSFFPALAAQNKDHWYNVETKSKNENKKKEESYPYDSVDSKDSKPRFARSYFWNLRPKVGFSGGFHADRRFFETGKANRLFFNTSLYFRNRPWHRWVANIQYMQNNSLFAGASWEITPSRKQSRFYYGAGLSHRLVSEKELNNFIEEENFHINLQCGQEILTSKDQAWNIEAKAFFSTNNQAIQLSLGYIFSI